MAQVCHKKRIAAVAKQQGIKLEQLPLLSHDRETSALAKQEVLGGEQRPWQRWSTAALVRQVVRQKLLPLQRCQIVQVCHSRTR